MCSYSPNISLPTVVLTSALLLFLFLCPFCANPPFNRFPNSPSGIYRLGTNTLDDYQKKLRLLSHRVSLLEDSEKPKDTKRKRAEILKKNGFKDEAQFEYLRYVVKWEKEKRTEEERNRNLS